MKDGKVKTHKNDCAEEIQQGEGTSLILRSVPKSYSLQANTTTNNNATRESYFETKGQSHK